MCLFPNRRSPFQLDFQVGAALCIRRVAAPALVACFHLAPPLSPDFENVILGEPPSCRLFLDACMKRIMGSVDPQAASLTMDWSPLDVDVLWYIFYSICAAHEDLRLMCQQFWRGYF
jgi:hypothetical protein